MSINKKQKTFKYSTCIMILILFFVTIFTILGMRAAIYNYNKTLSDEYVKNQLKTFDVVLNHAIEIGEFGVDNSSNKIQQDIEMKMDKEELKTIFAENLPSPEFDQILRSSLQKNVYTRHEQINQNRNSIFVILNDKFIASYAHYDAAATSIRMGYGVDVHEFIADNFFNTESGYSAIEKILNQDNGYIIWQRRDPHNPDIPALNTITIDDIHNILMTEGLSGLKSFEFLIPSYITEYGDVFGNYDDHNIKNINKDKIIIVQKLNIVDYINYHCPELFETDIMKNYIAEDYENLMVMFNIFIIIECLSIIAYAVLFIGYYNHTIIIDEMIELIPSSKENESKSGENDETILDNDTKEEYNKMDDEVK